MPSHRQLARLLPADCSAAVNTAIGMLAAQLDCGVEEAFRVLQVEAGEDPLGLERVSSQILARHAYLVAHSTRSGRQYPLRAGSAPSSLPAGSDPMRPTEPPVEAIAADAAAERVRFG